jgi:hypothetical protein
MVSHTGRLYSVALALVVFFLVWTVVAARPWGTVKADPRLKTLAAREVQLRREARLVNAVVARRWAVYRAALKARKAQIAAMQLASVSTSASSSVRVVTLPPLTITRTS